MPQHRMLFSSDVPINSEWISIKNKNFRQVVLGHFHGDILEVRGSDGVIRRVNSFKLQKEYIPSLASNIK
jgi:hypothetical protein